MAVYVCNPSGCTTSDQPAYYQSPMPSPTVSLTIQPDKDWMWDNAVPFGFTSILIAVAACLGAVAYLWLRQAAIKLPSATGK